MKRVFDVYESNINFVPYAVEGQCAIKMLPDDVLEFILAHLDESGIQSTNSVSKHWNQRSIKIVRLAHHRVARFAAFLGKNLQKERYGNEIAKLFAIADTRQFNITILKAIKAAKFQIKEDVLDVLKFLSEEDLSHLERLSEAEPKPQLFDNLFRLAPIYYKLDKADKIPESHLRGPEHSTISIELAKCGHYDKSIEVAKLIRLRDRQSYTFRSIYKIFVEQGYIDKALEVVNLLKYKLDQAEALKFISDTLVKRGDLEAAEGIAFEINDESIRSETRKTIYEAYKKIGRNEEADRMLKPRNRRAAKLKG